MRKKVKINKVQTVWAWYCTDCHITFARPSFNVILESAIHHIESHQCAYNVVLGYKPGGSVWERLRKGFVS